MTGSFTRPGRHYELGGAVTARTAGRARTTAALSVDQAAPNPSTARAPTTAATGPAAANASGPNAKAVTVLEGADPGQHAGGQLLLLRRRGEGAAQGGSGPGEQRATGDGHRGRAPRANSAPGRPYPNVATVAAIMGGADSGPGPPWHPAPTRRRSRP